MTIPTNPITSIKQYFDNHNGLQLANRFRVKFSNLPNAISIGDQSDGYVQAEYMALGPRAINTVQDNLNGYGYGRFVPRNQDLLSGGFGVQLIFPLTNDHHLTKFFDSWFDVFYKGSKKLQQSFTGSYLLPYYNLSVKDCSMQVELLNPNGGVNLTYNFYEVFPVETQPIELNMALTDKYLKYAVTFAFREFTQVITPTTP